MTASAALDDPISATRYEVLSLIAYTKSKNGFIFASVDVDAAEQSGVFIAITVTTVIKSMMTGRVLVTKEFARNSILKDGEEKPKG